MDYGLWIFRDDEFGEPIYAEPASEDVEPSLWTALCEIALEAFEGDAARTGMQSAGDWNVRWKFHSKSGLSFVVAADQDLPSGEVKEFLDELVQRYFDEVDDVRFPEADGVEDIVVDVIPPWEQ